MNLPSIIVLLLVAAALVAAIVLLCRGRGACKQASSPGGCSSCSGCALKDSCRK